MGTTIVSCGTFGHDVPLIGCRLQKDLLLNSPIQDFIHLKSSRLNRIPPFQASNNKRAEMETGLATAPVRLLSAAFIDPTIFLYNRIPFTVPSLWQMPRREEKPRGEEGGIQSNGLDRPGWNSIWKQCTLTTTPEHRPGNFRPRTQNPLNILPKRSCPHSLRKLGKFSPLKKKLKVF